MVKTSADNTNLFMAAHVYLSRRNRAMNPYGTFDKAGRWYPSDAEQKECCKLIRAPSRTWPWSLNSHCRSAQHVANLYGVPVGDLRRAARELEQESE